MKSRLDGDLGIVQRRGIDLYFSATRTAAKKIYGAALADHLKRPLPGGGGADRFNHGIGSASFLADLAHQSDRILDLCGIKSGNRAEAFSSTHLALALPDGNYAHSPTRENAYKFQSDWSTPDHDNCVAGVYSHFVNAAQDARERFGHGGVDEGNVIRNQQHVLAHDSSGDANIFGVGAIVKQQIFAKIRLAFAAVEASVARRGIRRHHAHAFTEAAISGASLQFNHASQLVTE